MRERDWARGSEGGHWNLMQFYSIRHFVYLDQRVCGQRSIIPGESFISSCSAGSRPSGSRWFCSQMLSSGSNCWWTKHLNRMNNYFEKQEIASWQIRCGALLHQKNVTSLVTFPELSTDLNATLTLCGAHPSQSTLAKVSIEAQSNKWDTLQLWGLYGIPRKTDQVCHLGQGLSITWFVFTI